MEREEFDGLVDGHFEDVVYVFSLETHVEDFLFETLAMTGLTFEDEVGGGHELHLDADGAIALTFRTAAALGVEAEGGGLEAQLLGEGLRGHEFAYLVVCLDIGCGVGARGLADGVLVDKLHGLDAVEIAFHRHVFARRVTSDVEMAQDGAIEDVAHEGAFPRTADACHHGHHAQGETDIDAFEVVGTHATQTDGAIPGTTRKRHFDLLRTAEEVDGVALSRRHCYVVVVGASPHHFAAQASGFGTDVDDIVGGTDDVFIVFHDNDGVSHIAQLAQDVDETLRVARMETDARLVEDIERATREEPNEVARLMRWLSPPERVLEGRLSVR